MGLFLSALRMKINPWNEAQEGPRIFQWHDFCGWDELIQVSQFWRSFTWKFLQVPQEVGKNFCLKLINLKSCLLWNNSDVPPIPFSWNVTLDFSISSGTSLRGGPSSFKVKDRMKTHIQSSYCSSCASLLIWDMWGLKLLHSVLIVFRVLWRYLPVTRSHFPCTASKGLIIRCWFPTGLWLVGREWDDGPRPGKLTIHDL